VEGVDEGAKKETFTKTDNCLIDLFVLLPLLLPGQWNYAPHMLPTVRTSPPRLCIQFIFPVPDWPNFSESLHFRGLPQILQNTCRN
jgi:hypothetical protein